MIENNQQVEWLLIPRHMKSKIEETKISKGSSLVQVKLLRDSYSGAYAGGLTMLNSETIERYFKYDRQEVGEDENSISINTYLKDSRGFTLIHHLKYQKRDAAVSVWTTFMK